RAAPVGPCKTLAPVLDKIAADYAGRLTVAKINVDEEQQLAGAAGIRSLPTLLLIRDGQPVDQIVGAQPDANIRAVLDRHVDEAEPAPPAPGEGLPDSAGQLRALLTEDPDNVAARTTLARIQVMEGNFDDAATTLAELSDDERSGPEARQVHAALGFAKAGAALTKTRGDLERAHAAEPAVPEHAADLAVRLIADGEHGAAAEIYLDLLRRQRQWDDDHARKRLLQLLDLLGADDPRTAILRRQMMSALY
ncbi:MAG: tetratricopeptide repeat protein, partial [Pseudomonadota bacterium]